MLPWGANGLYCVPVRDFEPVHRSAIPVRFCVYSNLNANFRFLSKFLRGNVAISPSHHLRIPPFAVEKKPQILYPIFFFFFEINTLSDLKPTPRELAVPAGPDH
jgi:hypothetical protein